MSARIFGEAFSTLFEDMGHIPLRKLKIVHTSDVQPVFMHRKHAHLTPCRNLLFEKVRHVQAHTGLHGMHHLRGKDINSCTDEEMMHGFFDDIEDALPFVFDDTIRDLKVVLASANRSSRGMLIVVLQEGLYALDGQVFKSLTAVARHITGTHWNGPPPGKTGGSRLPGGCSL